MKTNTTSFLRLFVPLAFLTMGFSCPALATDGFDNNYVGGNANQFAVTISGQNQALLFGPGQMSAGSFFINVPNGVTHDLGQVSAFTIASATSFLRSAYLDRVMSTTLYYRIYAAATAPPGWTMQSLQAQSSLLPDFCYSQTQNNTWQSNQSINVLQGLGNDDYVLEFYVRSELYDVGIEDDTCNVDALQQCNTTQVHPGRYISSRFNTTDPAACGLYNVIAGQSNPTKVTFHVIGSALPVELTYFSGETEDKTVRLRWGTAQEQGLKDFVIERSSNIYDWSDIGALPAHFQPVSDYDFLDQQPFRGRNYYRLRALDNNGHIDISPVIEVTVTDAEGQLAVWPNPARDILYYTTTAKNDELLTLRIVDTQGKVRTMLTGVPSGTSSLPIDDLEAGVYFLETEDQAGRHIAATRMVKIE